MTERQPPIPLVRAATVTWGGQLAFAGIGFVTVVVVARLLGPDGRGRLALLILLSTLLMVALELAQEAMASHLASRSPEAVDHVHANALLYALVIVPPAVAVLALSFLLVTGLAGRALAAAAFAGGLAVAAFSYVKAGGGIALGQGRVGLFNAARAALAASYLLAVVAVAALDSATVLAVFGAWCASYVLVAALLLVVHRGLRFAPSRAHAARQLRLGLPVHLGNVAQFLLLRSDQLLLGLLGTTVALGHYAVAVNVAETLWYVPLALGLVSLPFLSGAGSDEEKGRQLEIALSIALWVPALLAVLVAAAAPLVVPLLFGAAFAGSVLPLEILLVGVMAAGVARVATSALIARDRGGTVMRLTLLSLGVNVLLNLLLIPLWGAAGAALASTAAYVTLGAAVLRAGAREWGIALHTLLRPARTYGHVHAALLRRAASTGVG